MSDDLITIEEALVLIGCQDQKLSAQCRQMIIVLSHGSWKRAIDDPRLPIPFRLGQLGFGEKHPELPECMRIFRSGQMGRCP